MGVFLSRWWLIVAKGYAIFLRVLIITFELQDALVLGKHDGLRDTYSCTAHTYLTTCTLPGGSLRRIDVLLDVHYALF